MAFYWDTALRKRVGRRRLIGTSAGGLAGAALLAACGSSNKNSGSAGGGSSSATSSGDGGSKSSGLVAKPVDNLKDAKAGGTHKTLVTQDVQTFEPSFRSAPTAFASSHAYQNLITQKPGYLAPAPDEYTGDVVESWEISPDKLTMNLKIRQNGHWDQRAPTNGRPVDANDVVFAWNRFAAVATLRADLANAVNPAAPIVSMTATDKYTVSVKMDHPQASILSAISSRAASGFWIVPPESDGKFDVKKEQRGSGAYMLAEYTPSSRFVFEKNPGYWNANAMNVQRIEFPIVTEYAQARAQLSAGHVYVLPTPGIRPEDILSVKNETPALNLYATDTAVDGFHWFFGFEPSSKSPFKDVRVRQAFSMSIDRDLFIDTFYNVSKFKSSGLDMSTAWNSAVRADASAGWWADPQGKDFGENAKYYKRDIAAAKQLLAAAGFGNGLDVDAHHITTADYGADFYPKIQAILGMVPDSGIRVHSVPANYATDWQQKYRDVKGNFDGMAFVLEVGSGDAGDQMYALYNSKGSQFMGFTPDGSSTFAGDPTLDDLTNKIKTEYDANKRHAYGVELQKYEAKMQYYPRFPGGANGFQLAWPAIENWNVYRGGFFLEQYIWLNDQKAPLKG